MNDLKSDSLSNVSGRNVIIRTKHDVNDDDAESGSTIKSARDVVTTDVVVDDARLKNDDGTIVYEDVNRENNNRTGIGDDDVNESANLVEGGRSDQVGGTVAGKKEEKSSGKLNDIFKIEGVLFSYKSEI